VHDQLVGPVAVEVARPHPLAELAVGLDAIHADADVRQRDRAVRQRREVGHDERRAERPRGGRRAPLRGTHDQLRRPVAVEVADRQRVVHVGAARRGEHEAVAPVGDHDAGRESTPHQVHAGVGADQQLVVAVAVHVGQRQDRVELRIRTVRGVDEGGVLVREAPGQRPVEHVDGAAAVRGQGRARRADGEVDVPVTVEVARRDRRCEVHEPGAGAHQLDRARRHRPELHRRDHADAAREVASAAVREVLGRHDRDLSAPVTVDIADVDQFDTGGLREAVLGDRELRGDGGRLGGEREQQHRTSTPRSSPIRARRQLRSGAALPEPRRTGR
jgi:hypothetical protein